MNGDVKLSNPNNTEMNCCDSWRHISNIVKKVIDWSKANFLPNLSFFTRFTVQKANITFDLLLTPVQHYQHLPYICLFLLQSCMFPPVWFDWLLLLKDIHLQWDWTGPCEGSEQGVEVVQTEEKEASPSRVGSLWWCGGRRCKGVVGGGLVWATEVNVGLASPASLLFPKHTASWAFVPQKHNTGTPHYITVHG